MSGYEKCAHLYDMFDNKENIDFFHHYASQAGEILDIGAGTGRIAVPLAESDVKLFCVEPSPAMRREFRKKLSHSPELASNIHIIPEDAKSFNISRIFPAAFLSGCFDHFLNDDERVTSLSNIGNHLMPNGILVFDVFLGLMKDSPLSPAGKVNVGNREYRRLVSSKRLSENKMETILVFEEYENDKLVERFEEQSLAGITNREAIHRILKSTGFTIQHEWSDYNFTPFREGDTLLIIDAIKTGPSNQL
jgi:SAM-dependent methyltransferase